MSELQISKTIKNLMIHQDVKQIIKPSNIFLGCRRNQNNLQTIKSQYQIVGDEQFKKKYYDGKKTQRLNRTTHKQFKTQQQTSFNTTFCNYTRTIQDGTLASKLSKQKQLQLTRHHRTFMQLQNIKNRQEKIKRHLERRLSNFGSRQINNTITFSKKQIQLNPNPQLLQLINDNIPEFWKNSLRDNQKRLKRHIKGNTFKKQIAQQMLQTLRGRKKLVQSIPKIKQDFFQPICSRTCQKQKHKRSFSIKGQNKLRSDFTNTITENMKAQRKIPQIQFQQIYKISYNSASRWQASELC